MRTLSVVYSSSVIAFKIGKSVLSSPAAALSITVRRYPGDKYLGATVEELQGLDGVGAGGARTLRDGLSRLAEVSIVDRYS